MTDTRQQLAMRYRELFSTEHGKAVLADLDSQCFHQSQTFVPSDPYSSAFNAGMREVILRIHRRIEMKLDADEAKTAKMSVPTKEQEDA